MSKIICAFCFETRAHDHAVFGTLLVNEVSCSVQLKSKIPNASDVTFSEHFSKERGTSLDSSRSMRTKMTQKILYFGDKF